MCPKNVHCASSNSCVDIQSLVIADDCHTKRNVVSQLSWRKDHCDKIHSFIVEGKVAVWYDKKGSLVQGKVQGCQWQDRPSCRQQELPHCQPGSSISPPVACMEQTFFYQEGVVTWPIQNDYNVEKNPIPSSDHSRFTGFSILRIHNETNQKKSL